MSWIVETVTRARFVGQPDESTVKVVLEDGTELFVIGDWPHYPSLTVVLDTTRLPEVIMPHVDTVYAAMEAQRREIFANVEVGQWAGGEIILPPFEKKRVNVYVQTPLDVGQQLNVTIGGYGALRMSKFTFASRIARLSALA